MTFSFEVWAEPFDGRPQTLAAQGSYVTVHIQRDSTTGLGTSAPWPTGWTKALGVG